VGRHHQRGEAVTVDFNVFTLDERERVAIVIGVTELASRLAARETHRERRRRKLNIVEKKRNELEQIGVERDRTLESQLRAHLEGSDSSKRMLVLIEIAAADPFAPYETDWTECDHAEELTAMASALGVQDARACEVLATFKKMRKLHREISWMKVCGTAVAAATVLAATGVLTAPLIAGYIGAYAGLTGAAALAHGLAVLGGGSLAAGGMGMAGGLGLVSGIGAAGGLLGGALRGLNGAPNSIAAISELIKLGVTVVHVIPPNDSGPQQLAQEVMEQLVSMCGALEKLVEDEKQFSEAGSTRLNEFEKILRACRRTIAWLGSLLCKKAA
jgi:hypothetical protein